MVKTDKPCCCLGFGNTVNYIIIWWPFTVWPKLGSALFGVRQWKVTKLWYKLWYNLQYTQNLKRIHLQMQLAKGPEGECSILKWCEVGSCACTVRNWSEVVWKPVHGFWCGQKNVLHNQARSLVGGYWWLYKNVLIFYICFSVLKEAIHFIIGLFKQSNHLCHRQ